MNRWRDIKIKEVSEYVTVGFVGSMADQYVETGVPFLRSLNIQPFRLNYNDLKYIPESFHDSIKKSKLRPGDVAIVRTGYPGTACVIPADLLDANCSDLVILRPGPELNPHYIAAIFNSSFGQSLVGGNLVGAAQQHFNVTVAKELKLRLPPRSEQDKIAAVLVGLNDLIANNQRRIALLESMAEEIYREWFVRMRFPKSDEYANQTQVDLVPLEQLGTFLNGYPFDPTELHDEGLPIVKIKELNAGVCAGTPRNAGDKIPSRYKFGNGDIVFSWSGSLVVQVWHQGPALLNQHLFKVTPATGVSRDFLYFSIKFAIPIFESLTTGATMQHIKRKELRFVKVRVPQPLLMKAFDSLVSPLIEKALRLKQISVKLRAQREALLPRLISGKLRVDALDIQFPPSMQEQPPEGAAQPAAISS
ncbi:restriction endonuclease subunit S [Lysobacter sp. cf310]|uniref:restriction endonuclease subunit S n=1 Tax=Lysobacter sp. cf310 TaxID=1761790 RepID=UPI0008E4020F|nr:restriction endonuclease subunit S [Lysobacter sp. cf310]SFK53834.1 type I restriction enzyme, S subunit [Lysobacter sp. cf310]